MAARHDTDEVRAQRKATFLERYRRVGELRPACEAAGITRQTYRDWCRADEQFGKDCADAKQDAVDAAVEELRHRAVDGVEEPFLNKGEIVWKRDPETGDVLLDKNFEPIPLTRRLRSDRLLETYVKANRREYKDKGELAITGADGGPIQSAITIRFVDAKDGKPVDPLED